MLQAYRPAWSNADLDCALMHCIQKILGSVPASISSYKWFRGTIALTHQEIAFKGNAHSSVEKPMSCMQSISNSRSESLLSVLNLAELLPVSDITRLHKPVDVSQFHVFCSG